MMYLIKRRATTSREELVAHWFANHMPLVIAAQERQAAAGKPHASRYLVTLFDPDRGGNHMWDGVAQLWWDRALPMPSEPHGSQASDSFQQKAEPYVPWATTEYVVLSGSDQLPIEPLTLNPPFPCTRSGFLKMTFLVGAKAGTDYEEFFAHWLGVHVPNVVGVMAKVGGFRYVVSHSMNPDREPVAGMAELYFPGLNAARTFNSMIQPDGMERWTDPARMQVFRARTELIGIS